LAKSVARIEGYLQSQLSDYFRDAIATLREAADRRLSTDETIKAIHATLVRDKNVKQLSIPMPEEEPIELSEQKLEAIVRAIGSNSAPIDVEHTTRELARVYGIYRNKFARRLDARIVDVELRPEFASIWPEAFQLTSRDDTAMSNGLIVQLSTKASEFRNALGILAIRDIIRTADSLVQRRLVHPSTMRLQMTANIALCKACEFQLRFGKRAESMEQLCDAGILSALPMDPLFGLPLSIDRDSIVGPPLQMVRERIPIPSDVPPFRWSIPYRAI
jgi:hypothetical protein